MIDSMIVVECWKITARITSLDGFGIAIGFPLFLPRECLLLRNPFVKFSDGFTLHRKLDVDVDGLTSSPLEWPMIALRLFCWIPASIICVLHT
jgi:hypothetical protein